MACNFQTCRTARTTTNLQFAGPGGVEGGGAYVICAFSEFDVASKASIWKFPDIFGDSVDLVRFLKSAWSSKHIKIWSGGRLLSILLANLRAHFFPQSVIKKPNYSKRHRQPYANLS